MNRDIQQDSKVLSQWLIDPKMKESIQKESTAESDKTIINVSVPMNVSPSVGPGLTKNIFKVEVEAEDASPRSPLSHAAASREVNQLLFNNRNMPVEGEIEQGRPSGELFGEEEAAENGTDNNASYLERRRTGEFGQNSGVDSHRPNGHTFSTYIQIGCALYQAEGKKGTASDIRKRLRELYTFYDDYNTERMNTVISSSILHDRRKQREAKIFEKIELTDGRKNGNLLYEYKLKPRFIRLIKDWRKNYSDLDLSGWLKDQPAFMQLLDTICADDGSSWQQSPQEARRNERSSPLSSYETPSSVLSHPIFKFPRHFLCGMAYLLAAHGTRQPVDQLFIQFGLMFPVFRKLSEKEKAVLIEKTKQELNELKRSSEFGKCLEKHKVPWNNGTDYAWKFEEKIFLNHFDKWLRKNKEQAREWVNWTDKPGEFYEHLETIFNADLSFLPRGKIPSIPSPRRAAVHPPVQQVENPTEPEGDFPAIIALILGNSRAKRMFRRDIHQALDSLFPALQMRGAIRIADRVLRLTPPFGFSSKVFKSYNGTNSIYKKYFFIDPNEELEERKLKLLEDAELARLTKNKDDIAKLVSGEWTAYESDFDGPMGKEAEAFGESKEEVYTLKSRTTVNSNQTFSDLDCTSRLEIPESSRTRRSSKARKFEKSRYPTPQSKRKETSAHRKAREERQEKIVPSPIDKKVKIESEEPKYPFGLTFDWRELDFENFETFFAYIAENSETFPVSTSTEEYKILRPLYEKYHEVIKQTLNADLPNWEGRFGPKLLISTRKRPAAEDEWNDTFRNIPTTRQGGPLHTSIYRRDDRSAPQSSHQRRSYNGPEVGESFHQDQRYYGQVNMQDPYLVAGPLPDNRIPAPMPLPIQETKPLLIDLTHDSSPPPTPVQQDYGQQNNFQTAQNTFYRSHFNNQQPASPFYNGHHLTSSYQRSPSRPGAHQNYGGGRNT